MAPRLSRTVKVKDVCIQCGYMRPELGRGKRYKCAVTGVCPGITWSEAERKRFLESYTKGQKIPGDRYGNIEG